MVVLEEPLSGSRRCLYRAIALELGCAHLPGKRPVLPAKPTSPQGARPLDWKVQGLRELSQVHVETARVVAQSAQALRS